MRWLTCLALAAALGAMTPAVAAESSSTQLPSTDAATGRVPVVSVTFEHPEQYSDLGHQDAEATLKEIDAWLQKMGAMYLPPGQMLALRVLDMDQAGEERLVRRSGRIDRRILHGGADWPRIHVTYVLSTNAAELARGEETISDMNYLTDPLPPTLRDEPLAYEKRMLQKWFRSRFASGNQ
jgi:hypothetical protein